MPHTVGQKPSCQMDVHLVRYIGMAGAILAVDSDLNQQPDMNREAEYAHPL